MEKENKLKLVLGLEIHLHLRTETKMFCRCPADIYTAKPNTHTCPVCLGLPGALPVPNYSAVKMVQLLGLALNSTINKNAKFDRKHYFYPDLPKGYQISQYKEPFCTGGYITLDSGAEMEIERIHLEEDTAKSFHQNGVTLIDFNKSGMPLVEIVTKPVFTSVEDAVEFCKKVQTTVRFLDIGDVDMEKGQMRLEANISLRTPEMEKLQKLPNYKVEIKNINSFRFMEKAVLAEIARQSEIIASGGVVKQENRGFNEATGKTVSQRDKEEAHDYRYFPEPDIPPMVFTDDHANNLKKLLPMLPYEKVAFYVMNYEIPKSVAATLVYTFGSNMCQKFENIVQAGVEAKKAANYLLNKKEYQNLTVQEFIEKIKSEQIKVTDVSELQMVASTVIEKNTKAVEDYKKGKQGPLEFLVGMVMKETRGKADAVTVRSLLEKLLNS